MAENDEFIFLEGDNGEKPSRKSLGKKNRQKGHQAERDLVAIFKEAGFNFCCTTRLSSRLLDNCGIDLDFLPVIIQSKAGKQTSLNHLNELQSIDERVKTNLPPESEWRNKPKAIVQLGNSGRGRRKTEYHDKVTMNLTDFIILLKKAYLKNDTVREEGSD